MSTPHQLARAAVGLTLLASSMLSCERKAPGPEECARFAEAVVGANRYVTPAMDAQIERQTQECLTRPYDRELLSCVLLTRQARSCLASFRARNGDSSESEGLGRGLPE